MEKWLRYRGQWGGRIDTGEEMWWSEPRPSLRTSRLSRLFFKLDVRQHFILRFWGRARSGQPGRPPVVVDYGCGTGGTTLNFSQVMGVPVIGVDVFETQLRIARDFSSDLGLGCRFERIGQGGDLPFPDGSVDAVLSLDVLGHVPDIPACARELARVLRPGGSVLLFTESNYSAGDRSLMARLAARGADMMQAVPEHISLLPRETLEEIFAGAGFEVRERFSANVMHFLFFPKDYVLLLRNRREVAPNWYRLALLWNRVSKITPFYPWPFQALRLLLTLALGGRSHGTSYFYHLEKKALSS